MSTPKVDFAKMDGLVPGIVQDAKTAGAAWITGTDAISGTGSITGTGTGTTGAGSGSTAGAGAGSGSGTESGPESGAEASSIDSGR